MLTRLTFLLALMSALVAHAQVPLTPEALANAEHLFENHGKKNTLHCSVDHFNPFLDFTFRYEAGFLVSVSPAELVPGSHPNMYIRVTPEDGKPIILGERLEIPEIPPMIIKRVGLKQLKQLEMQISDGFALGDGRYAIDLLLTDNQERSCHQRWKLKTPKHVQPLTMQPNTVTPIETYSWDGKLDSNGVRLTVLLHAAPINRYAPKLYAWDREFLLQSLASLLKQFPCQSVRVAVFNLDQQQEVFHQDQFDSKGYQRLTRSLYELEFATV